MTLTEFSYTELLPIGPDTTKYKLLTTEGVSVVEVAGKKFLQVSQEAIEKLSYEATYTLD